MLQEKKDDAGLTVADHQGARGGAGRCLWVAMLSLTVGVAAEAVPVTLQNNTATLSQGGFSVVATTDANLANNNGWGIQDGSLVTSAQTAVWETQSDVGHAGGTTLTFSLIQNYTATGGQHTVGRFRLSYTTDNRSTFADGLTSGGDVTATWTVMVPTSPVSTGGATLTAQGDNSILASGTNPSTASYTVAATVPGGTLITGFRLEVMEDASLPTNGPGRMTNGNFVLTEVQVDEVQAPVTLLSIEVD